MGISTLEMSFQPETIHPFLFSRFGIRLNNKLTGSKNLAAPQTGKIEIAGAGPAVVSLKVPKLHGSRLRPTNF